MEKRKLTLIYDLDKTLCTKKGPNESYVDVKPIQPIIDQLNQFYDEGHEIIISTARNMVTQSNQVSKVVKNVGQITLEWLEKHGVQYHGIQFGKEYGDLYIDDKACINDPDEINRRITAIHEGREQDYIDSNLKLRELFTTLMKQFHDREKEFEDMKNKYNEQQEVIQDLILERNTIAHELKILTNPETAEAQNKNVIDVGTEENKEEIDEPTNIVEEIQQENVENTVSQEVIVTDNRVKEHFQILEVREERSKVKTTEESKSTLEVVNNPFTKFKLK